MQISNYSVCTHSMHMDIRAALVCIYTHQHWSRITLSGVWLSRINRVSKINSTYASELLLNRVCLSKHQTRRDKQAHSTYPELPVKSKFNSSGLQYTNFSNPVPLMEPGCLGSELLPCNTVQSNRIQVKPQSQKTYQ